MNQKFHFIRLFRFCDLKNHDQKRKISQKKTCRNKHKRIEQNNNQRCLFYVNSDRHHCSRCKLQIHFRYKCNEIFLSMKNQIEKSLQANCYIS